MSLGLILLIILVLVVIGALPHWPYSNRWGYYPSGGAGLLFDYPIDLTKRPLDNQAAMVTNLFYWNNVMHDVIYVYGFNEAARNFQLNNYGKGGLGNDYVRAEV